MEPEDVPRLAATYSAEAEAFEELWAPELLPLGTANDLARTLGLPLDLAAAAEVIGRGHTRRIDVGLVNGHAFFNVASIGLSADLAGRLTGLDKRRWGRLAYAARALDNGIYVVFAGLAGRCGPWEFNGGSAVYDPEGRPLGRLGTGRGLVLADLDPATPKPPTEPSAPAPIPDAGPAARLNARTLEVEGEPKEVIQSAADSIAAAVRRSTG